MARAIAAIVLDITDAANAIGRYTADGHAAFAADEKGRFAVIARLIHLGQGVKDLQAAGIQLRELHPEIDWKQVAGLRDRLAHQYWGLDVDLLWTFIDRQLPKIVAAIQDLGRTAGEPRPRSRRRPAGK